MFTLKPKPAPLTRRQSFNGDVKPVGQPPSPLIQQVARKKGQQEEPGAPLHAKSNSLSSLLVNDDSIPPGMVNGLTDFGRQRGQELSATGNSNMPLSRQSIIDIQKDIQPFVVATTKLKETINKVATGKNNA